MKCFIFLTLVALATASDDCPHPHPRGPAIFVRSLQEARRWRPYVFKFAVAGMKPLRESEVNLKKIVRGDRHPELVDTDFKVVLRTLSEEEIEEWHEDLPEDPRPHFKSVIVGKVYTGRLSCKDQSPYLVRYGDRHHEEVEGLEVEDDDHHHHDNHGFFFIRVEGCPKPEPHPSYPAIFVKPMQVAAINETYSFKFGVASMESLCPCKVHLKKIVKGDRHPELVDTDFKVSLKVLSEEEIEDWMDKKDEKDPRPTPRKHFKHGIIGSVTTGELTCDDQAPYIVLYDRRHGEEELELGDCPHPHPHPKPRGFFYIMVKGCPRPHDI